MYFVNPLGPGTISFASIQFHLLKYLLKYKIYNILYILYNLYLHDYTQLATNSVHHNYVNYNGVLKTK